MRPTQRERAAFPRALAFLLDFEGITQSELARRAFGRAADGSAIGRDRISKYLDGKTYPQPASLARLARGLRVSEDVLRGARSRRRR